jgi:hypothetical protein
MTRRNLLCLLVCGMGLSAAFAADPESPAAEPQAVGVAKLPVNTWVRLNPTDPPKAPWYRGLSGAVYCPKAKRVFFWGAGFSNSAGSRYYPELLDPATGRWRQIGPQRAGAQAGPPLRMTFAMLVCLPEANRVLYPYADGDPARSTTWAFDLGAGKWIDLKPKTSPRVVPNSAAVYDTRNKVVVLFGGSFDAEPQTWLYDPAANEWRKAATKTSPSARIWHNMTFDEKTGRVVLFGGHDGKRELADTWTFDAATQSWAQQTPAAHPGPRCGHAMAYDAANAVTILFGGCTTRYNDEKNEEAFLYQKSHSHTGVKRGDTWAYDAAANRWTKLAPQASPPPAGIVSGAMAYDRHNEALILMHPWKPRYPKSRRYNTSQVWALRYRPQ